MLASMLHVITSLRHPTYTTNNHPSSQPVNNAGRQEENTKKDKQHGNLHIAPTADVWAGTVVDDAFDVAEDDDGRTAAAELEAAEDAGTDAFPTLGLRRARLPGLAGRLRDIGLGTAGLAAGAVLLGADGCAVEALLEVALLERGRMSRLGGAGVDVDDDEVPVAAPAAVFRGTRGWVGLVLMSDTVDDWLLGAAGLAMGTG